MASRDDGDQTDNQTARQTVEKQAAKQTTSITSARRRNPEGDRYQRRRKPGIRRFHAHPRGFPGTAWSCLARFLGQRLQRTYGVTPGGIVHKAVDRRVDTHRTAPPSKDFLSRSLVVHAVNRSPHSGGSPDGRPPISSPGDPPGCRNHCAAVARGNRRGQFRVSRFGRLAQVERTMKLTVTEQCPNWTCSCTAKGTRT